MGIFELRLPDIGEGVAEAELVRWLVGPGDRVRVDDPVAEVMTDKATVELPSPVNGSVAWLAVEEGHRVAVGAPVIRFEVDASHSEPEPAAASTGPARGAPGINSMPPTRPLPSPRFPEGVGGDGGSVGSPPPRAPEPVPGADSVSAEAAREDTAPSTAPVVGPGSRPLAAPAVRRRAAEAGVDLRLLRGSGPAGRIEHDDLDRYLDAAAATAPAAATASTANTTVTDVPVTGIRRVIAENMADAATRIPHITYVEEVDVTDLERLRAHLNGRRLDSRCKLTPLAFVVRALVTAIADHPAVNARFDDDAMVVHRFGGVHVGIATQTPKGLVVPVLRHAEARDVWECAEEILRLATAARQGTVERSELSGSTITISSLGALGGIITTPIINRPEVAIVGVNKMQVRPVWDGSRFIPRTMVNLSSAFDHRIIDGWDAAAFISRVKECMEQPALMFMEGR